MSQPIRGQGGHLVFSDWPEKRKQSQQETAKDSMAGLQSGNKIWEDLLRTTLNAMVNLRYCMTLKFEWTKSRSQKQQQNLRRPTRTNLNAKFAYM